MKGLCMESREIVGYPYELLTKYFLEVNNITTDMEYEILSIPARELLTANRFDLMAKWIYIDAMEKGLDMAHARELYIRHIDAFTDGSFIEPGKEEKNSAEKFVQVFANGGQVPIHTRTIPIKNHHHLIEKSPSSILQS